jgi:hypothetical protein
LMELCGGDGGFEVCPVGVEGWGGVGVLGWSQRIRGSGSAANPSHFEPTYPWGCWMRCFGCY